MLCRLAFIILLSSAYSTAHAAAAKGGGDAPVTFNLAPGAQVANPETSVVGLRVNGSYGTNKNMYGLDLGVLGNNTSENFGGLAIAGITNITGKAAYVVLLQAAGLVNINNGKGYVGGLQIAGLANTISEDGKVFGAQIAILTNYAPKTDVYGLQAGVINSARRVVGFQIGLFNFADDLRGIQVGVFNWNARAVPLKMFPIVNIGF